MTPQFHQMSKVKEDVLHRHVGNFIPAFLSWSPTPTPRYPGLARALGRSTPTTRGVFKLNKEEGFTKSRAQDRFSFGGHKAAASTTE